MPEEGERTAILHPFDKTHISEGYILLCRLHIPSSISPLLP